MTQPIISLASSSKKAWERLLHSYANASQSRIIMLKSKLVKNPKGNKSVVEFLNEIRSIADELALIQNPIIEENLVFHIITQLGDEFNSLDAERKRLGVSSIIHTVNVIQRQNSKGTQSQRSFQGHTTGDSRKLAKFLRENNISFVSNSQSPNAQQSLVANATTAALFAQQPWLFDSGASHRVTSNSLRAYADYGGLDEVFLGDGNSFPISHTVNNLSKFMHDPPQLHLQDLKRVHYLKGTIHHGLFLNQRSPITLTTFFDSDWGGIKDNGHSTTAYILYLGSNIIPWRSARHKSISHSSTKAEYKALANASAEMIWV
uniref:Putative LRR receptor kinase n=1 Tax=Tanacetum cinerariifolium TaxID=118510 RepID=A0A699HHS4_TANCI|nr:putative LRR receptor kinase [Tanacetum cinerariifolium]